VLFSKIRMEQDILRDAREKLGLTQQEVADKSKIKLRQYQRFESGERNLSASSFEIARRVLEVLELDMTSFARGDYVISGEAEDIPIDIEKLFSNIYTKRDYAQNVFRDKICVFIGRLEYFSREEAQEILFEAGGVPQNNLAVFVSYVITGRGTANTKIYKDAKKLEQQGFLTIITEHEFFTALNGRFIPSENSNRSKAKRDVITINAREPADDFSDVLDNKRAAYLSARKVRATSR